MVQPDLILTPFGQNANPGTINEIPETLSPSDPVQSASWNAGFPQVTMTPLSAGGIPPRGQDVNGALRAISRHVAFLGGGGQYKWSSAYVAKNGGYAIGDVIQANDGLNSYVSLVDANTIDFNSIPASIGTSWQLYSGSGLIQVQATETTLGITRFSTSPLALSGVNDSTSMTPLKVKQALDQKLPFVPVQQGGGVGQDSNKLNVGWDALARLRLSVDGLDFGAFVLDSNLTAFLPKRTFTATDYIRIPDVPGGLIIQWAEGVNSTIAAGGLTAQSVSLPISFPSAVLKSFITTKYVSGVTTTASEAPTGTTTSLISVNMHNPVATGAGTGRPVVLSFGY